MRNLRLATLPAVALVLVAALLLIVRPTTAQDPAPTTARTVPLDIVWNLVGWTGESTALPQAIATIQDQTDAAATFDAASQRFQTWNADAPAFLNSLAAISPDAGIWVRVANATEWPQPLTIGPRQVPLTVGFNLVAWIGPSQTPVEEAIAALADAVDAVFAFDAAAQTTRAFRPGGPAFLNDLTRLAFGQGLWLLMNAEAVWTQPGPTEPGRVAGPTDAVTLDVPAGALPAGLTLADIQITDVSNDPAALSVDGADGFVAYALERSGATFAAPLSLTVRFPAPAGASIFAVTISETGIEPLDLTSIEVDPDAGEVTLTAQQSHFSLWLHLVRLEAGGLDLQPMPLGPSLVVGKTFTVQAQVQRQDFEVVEWFLTSHLIAGQAYTGSGYYRVRPRSGWSLRARFEATGPIEPLTPTTQEKTFPPEGPSGDTIEQQFTCTEPGGFTIRLSTTARLNATASLAVGFDPAESREEDTIASTWQETIWQSFCQAPPRSY